MTTYDTLPKSGSSGASASLSQKTALTKHALYNTGAFRQKDLYVGDANSSYEKEADAMAEKVMCMPAPGQLNFSSPADTVNRKCAECEAEEELNRKEISFDAVPVAPPLVHDVLNSPGGRPLDSDTRAFMEPRFNYDFSNVKIHDNEQAAQSAGSINALAYTSGNNIVFNSGQYNTHADSGKKLLAHELTHVVQQNQPRKNENGFIPFPGGVTQQVQEKIARKVIWKDITSLPGDMLLILDVDDGDFVGGCVKATVPHVGAKLIKKSPHTEIFNVHIGVTTNKAGQKCVFFYESVSGLCEMKCFNTIEELKEALEEIMEWIKEMLKKVFETLAIVALIVIAGILIYLIAEAIAAALVLVLALA